MNAKIIEALKGVRDNLNIIIEESEGLKIPVNIEEPEVAEPKEEGKEKKKDNVVPINKKVEKKEEPVVANEDGEEITSEYLETLSYNDLKKLAKELGVTATGARPELTQKILNAGQEDIEQEEVVEEEEVETKKKPEAKKKNSPVKLGKKEEDLEEEVEEEEEDPLVVKVHEAVDGMTDEEILDVLTDVGVKAKGKRQALINAVIKAVREGKIELDDGGDEPDTEEPEVEEEVVEDGELDFNDFDNEDMTDERKKAMEDFENSTRADFEEGAITRKDLVDWLNDYNGTKGAMKDKSDEEILEEYIYYSWLLIDDEGEMPEEEGAYTVNGHPFCCGRPLEYLEENNTFICEYCGTEYEGA